MSNDYAYQAVWSDEDGEYVGICAEFPSISWLDPDREAALSGIRELVADCVDDMRACGEAPPEAGGGAVQGFFSPSGSPTRG